MWDNVGRTLNFDKNVGRLWEFNLTMWEDCVGKILEK